MILLNGVYVYMIKKKTREVCLCFTLIVNRAYNTLVVCKSRMIIFLYKFILFSAFIVANK